MNFNKHQVPHGARMANSVPSHETKSHNAYSTGTTPKKKRNRGHDQKKSDKGSSVSPPSAGQNKQAHNRQVHHAMHHGIDNVHHFAHMPQPQGPARYHPAEGTPMQILPDNAFSKVFAPPVQIQGPASWSPEPQGLYKRPSASVYAPQYPATIPGPQQTASLNQVLIQSFRDESSILKSALNIPNKRSNKSKRVRGSKEDPVPPPRPNDVMNNVSMKAAPTNASVRSLGVPAATSYPTIPSVGSMGSLGPLGSVTGVRPYELPRSSSLAAYREQYSFNPMVAPEPIMPAGSIPPEDVFVCVSPFSDEFSWRASNAPMMSNILAQHLREKQIERNFPQGKPYETTSPFGAEDWNQRTNRQSTKTSAKRREHVRKVMEQVNYNDEGDYITISPFDDEWEKVTDKAVVPNPKKVEILPHEVQTAIGNPPEKIVAKSAYTRSLEAMEEALTIRHMGTDIPVDSQDFSEAFISKKQSSAAFSVKQPKNRGPNHKSGIIHHPNYHGKGLRFRLSAAEKKQVLIKKEHIQLRNEASVSNQTGLNKVIAQNSFNVKNKKRRQTPKRASTHWAVSPFDSAFEKLCNLPVSKPKPLKKTGKVAKVPRAVMIQRNQLHGFRTVSPFDDEFDILTNLPPCQAPEVKEDNLPRLHFNAVSPWDAEGWNARTNTKKIPKKSEAYKMLQASHQGKVYVTFHKPEAEVKKFSLHPLLAIKDGTVGNLTSRIALSSQISFPLAISVNQEIFRQAPVLIHSEEASGRTGKKSVRLGRNGARNSFKVPNFSKKPMLMIKDGTVGSFILGDRISKKASAKPVEARHPIISQRASTKVGSKKIILASTKKFLESDNSAMAIGREQSVRFVRGSTASDRGQSFAGTSAKQLLSESEQSSAALPSSEGAIVEVEMQPISSVFSVKKPLLGLMDSTVGKISSKASLKFGSTKSKSKSLGKMLKQIQKMGAELEPVEESAATLSSANKPVISQKPTSGNGSWVVLAKTGTNSMSKSTKKAYESEKQGSANETKKSKGLKRKAEEELSMNDMPEASVVNVNQAKGPAPLASTASNFTKVFSEASRRSEGLDNGFEAVSPWDSQFAILTESRPSKASQKRGDDIVEKQVTAPALQKSLKVSSKKMPKGSEEGRQSFISASPWDEQAFERLTNLPVSNATPKVKLSQKLLNRHPSVPSMSSRFFSVSPWNESQWNVLTNVKTLPLSGRQIQRDIARVESIIAPSKFSKVDKMPSIQEQNSSLSGISAASSQATKNLNGSRKLVSQKFEKAGSQSSRTISKRANGGEEPMGGGQKKPLMQKETSVRKVNSLPSATKTQAVNSSGPDGVPRWSQCHHPGARKNRKKPHHPHHHGHGIHGPTKPGPHERKERMLMRYYGVWPYAKPANVDNVEAERSVFTAVSPFSRDFKKIDKLPSFKPRASSVRQLRFKRKSERKSNPPPKAALINHGESFRTVSPFSEDFEKFTNLPPQSVVEKHASLFVKRSSKSVKFTHKSLKSKGIRQTHLKNVSKRILGSTSELDSASPWNSMMWNQLTGVKKLTFKDQLKMSRDGHPHTALSKSFVDAVDYALNNENSFLLTQDNDVPLKTFESMHPQLVNSVRSGAASQRIAGEDIDLTASGRKLAAVQSKKGVTTLQSKAAMKARLSSIASQRSSGRAPGSFDRPMDKQKSVAQYISQKANAVGKSQASFREIPIEQARSEAQKLQFSRSRSKHGQSKKHKIDRDSTAFAPSKRAKVASQRAERNREQSLKRMIASNQKAATKMTTTQKLMASRSKLQNTVVFETFSPFDVQFEEATRNLETKKAPKFIKMSTKTPKALMKSKNRSTQSEFQTASPWSEDFVNLTNLPPTRAGTHSSVAKSSKTEDERIARLQAMNKKQYRQHKNKPKHYHHHGHGIHSPTRPGPHERKARMIYRYYQAMSQKVPSGSPESPNSDSDWQIIEGRDQSNVQAGPQLHSSDTTFFSVSPWRSVWNVLTGSNEITERRPSYVGLSGHTLSYTGPETLANNPIFRSAVSGPFVEPNTSPSMMQRAASYISLGSQGSKIFSNIFGSSSELQQREQPRFQSTAALPHQSFVQPSFSYSGIPTNSVPQYVVNAQQTKTFGSFSGVPMQASPQQMQNAIPVQSQGSGSFVAPVTQQTRVFGSFTGAPVQPVAPSSVGSYYPGTAQPTTIALGETLPFGSAAPGSTMGQYGSDPSGYSPVSSEHSRDKRQGYTPHRVGPHHKPGVPHHPHHHGHQRAHNKGLNQHHRKHQQAIERELAKIPHQSVLVSQIPGLSPDFLSKWGIAPSPTAQMAPPVESEFPRFTPQNRDTIPAGFYMPPSRPNVLEARPLPQMSASGNLVFGPHQ